MKKVLPDVLVEGFVLSDLFFNFYDSSGECGTEEAANEFSALLNGKISPEELLFDYKNRE